MKTNKKYKKGEESYYYTNTTTLNSSQCQRERNNAIRKALGKPYLRRVGGKYSQNDVYELGLQLLEQILGFESDTPVQMIKDLGIIQLQRLNNLEGGEKFEA